MPKKTVEKKSATANKMATRKKAVPVKNTDRSGAIIRTAIYTGLLLAALVAVAFSYLWFKENYQPQGDLMPIRIIEITGNLEHVSREQIMETLLKVPGTQLTKQPDSQSSEQKDAAYMGFFGSDLQLLEQQLKNLAWLQTAELRRVWPDRLQIKIKEQKAIARWNNKSLINEFGEIFIPDSIEGYGYLPLLTGPDQELQQLLLTFRELQQRLVVIDMALKVLNLNHRYSWSLELNNGIQLEVGRNHLIERVERFIALYPLLKSESDLAVIKVDLRYDTGLAVTRLETSELQASL